jgi:hypothetical protein
MRVTAFHGLNKLGSRHNGRPLRKEPREERFVKLGVQWQPGSETDSNMNDRNSGVAGGLNG